MAMMKSLRATLQDLRPPEINDFGLAASLLSLAKSQERLAGGKLRIQLKVGDDLQDVPSTAASHIYRIVQEGLTNIGKHANASRASVALDFRPEAPDQAMPGRRWLALTIEEDGMRVSVRSAPETTPAQLSQAPLALPEELPAPAIP